MSTRDPKLMLANSRLADELRKTRQQRDDLLAACEALLQTIENIREDGRLYSNDQKRIVKARAAVAEARGNE